MAKLEGAWSLGEVQLRRVGIEDRQKVAEIHDDVYGGFDYLPEKYNQFCHGHRYFMYMAEARGIPLAFTAFYVIKNTPGRVEVLGGCSRTSEDTQGIGVMRKLGDFMDQDALKIFPGSFAYLTVANRSPLWDKRVENGTWTILQKWRQFRWKLTKQDIRSHLDRFANDARPNLITPSPSDMSDIKKMLPAIQQAVGSYGSYVVYDNNWLLSEVTSDAIREISLKHRLAITQGDLGLPLSMSILSRTKVKYGLRCDVHYYGNDIDDFLAHLYHQIKTIESTTNLTNIGLVAHFPMSFNVKKTEKALSNRFGQWFNPNSEIWLSKKYHTL